MKIMWIDEHDGILRRVFRTVIFGIPLVYILGWPVLIVFVVPPIFSLGMDRARRPGDVAARPFSFCLPGFRESLRKQYFSAAVLMGLGACVFVPALVLYARFQHASVADADPVKVCLRMAAAFLAGMVMAFAVGTLRFVLSRLAWNVLMLLSIPLFLLAIVAVPAFIEYPLFGIPPCAVACVFIWFRLGNMRRVRQGHRVILEDALERRVQVGVTRTASPEVERLFRWFMEHRNLNAKTYIWGSLYRAFGLAFSYWKWIAVSIAVVALILGYAGPWFVKTAFMALGLMALKVHLPVAFDDMLLPMGPRERHHATLAVGAAASFLLIGTAGFVAVCTWILSLFLSARDGSGYAGIDPRDICLAGLPTPWVLGCRLLAYTHPRIADTITKAAVLLALAALWLVAVADIPWPEPAGTILLAVGLAGGWPFFLLALRGACTGVPRFEPNVE